MHKAVFLDRDGTVIADRGYLADPDGVSLLPGAGEALAALAHAGFKLIIVSNQSGIGRGLFPAEAVHAQHRRLGELLAAFGVKLDAAVFCPHTPDDGCACRKPSPAMILAQAQALDIDVKASFMVGDKHSDVLAGKAAGCRTVFLGAAPDADADRTVRDLAAAAKAILRNRRQ